MTDTVAPLAPYIAEQLHDLETARNELDQQIQAKQQELAAALQQSGQKETITPAGQGYRLKFNKTTTFQPGAYAFIQNEGIEDLFRSEPKITQTAVKKLTEGGWLTVDQINALNAYKEVDSTGEYSITRFAPRITQADAVHLVKGAKERIEAEAAAAKPAVQRF